MRRLISDHVRQAGDIVSPPRQNKKVIKNPFQTWQARANIVTGAANSRQTGTANVYDCDLAKIRKSPKTPFKLGRPEPTL